MLEKFVPTKSVGIITDISIDWLKINNVAGIILDMDSTITDKRYARVPKIKEWIANVKSHNIYVCIVTNSFKADKTKQIAEYMDVPYLCYALKPFPLGFMRAMKILGEDKKDVIVIGDQMLTDILGANAFGIRSILVKPLEKNEGFFMKLKRKIERYIKSNA